ncbi:MAG TPA: GlsB/YeaQ/YmgE family stress response membrane protein, partial [Motilibacteraceae bacterium]|nr:GlsB/YeaQ/YmgE family stress response membrane protein [Motilibacteraceae bacterium]
PWTRGGPVHILWAIIAGLIIGVIARALLRGRQDIPIWLTIVLGIIGGLIGDAIASGLGVRETNGFDWIRHILQVVAAMVLIGVVAPFWARRRHVTR